MEVTQLGFGFEAASDTSAVEGLRYVPLYASRELEATAIAAIDAGEWRTDLARRVQHYGWRYDYKARRIDRSSYLGPLPPWAAEIASQLALDGRMATPDQLIINEYEPGQGIAAHTDCGPCFGPTVYMISLLSDIQMDFSRGPTERTEQGLERRSLLVLAGPARLQWRHGIAKRATDPKFGIRRSRRVSLTFRTVTPLP